MARLLIKAKVERKDPAESRLVNAFSEAVKTIRSNAISRNSFIAEYNAWCQKIQSNIAFLNESHQIFLERTSPSTLQRFFVTTFAAVCFLESLRNKSADCCFTGVFFCFLLTLMSFITAIIGLLSTTPDKSVKSILNWISTMNVLSKETSHRLNRTLRVFQIIPGSDMLYTNLRETNHHANSRWNYFFRLFFLNFLSWFSIYGTAFAVQVCVIMKVLSFMELTEVLKSFSLLMIFINALIQDIKIRRIRREIHYQTCCLDSETEKFLRWFQDRSDLGLLLEQYKFLKEPVLNTLKCGNDIDKITSSHSLILFAITVIKVSDGLQDSINSENLQTILQSLLFNDPNMCSKTKVELISDKTPDIPSVLQTTKDLAQCFLQLGTVLKDSKLASSIPVESAKENKSGAILQKILSPKEILPADKKSSRKHLKKSKNVSKIPKKIPEDLNRSSVGNKKDKLSKISDTVTKDRHIKENKSETALKTTSKVSESKDFDSEKNKPLTSLDILPSPLLVTKEKPQEIDLGPESEVDGATNSDIEENKKQQSFQKAIFKATESDGFNSEENKLSTSLNNMPSTSLVTMEKHDKFVLSPKSEANYGDASTKKNDKTESEKNDDLQNEQSNSPKDVILHSSPDQEVLNSERENEQLNRSKDVILHSTLDQELANDEDENEQSSLPNGMVLHSSLAQEVLNDEGENEDSSIPENTVLHSQHNQEILGEESNREIPSPADDRVLHSSLVQKSVDENENKIVPAPEEMDSREANRNASISLKNTEHDDMKIGVSCTETESSAVSNALDKDKSDGQIAEKRTVVGNVCPVSEIKFPLIPSKVKELVNDSTSASSSVKQTNGKKDIDFAQQSVKGDNIGTMNKSALKETPVKTNVAISKRNFMTVNSGFNQGIAETDETANANFKNSDETFHTAEVESSSAVKTHSNPEVETPGKIHLQGIKLEADDFEAGTLESGRDKNLKSIHVDKTFIDQSNSLNYIGSDGKNIRNHQNGYQQPVEDNEQKLGTTVFADVLRETVRNFFEHQNLPMTPIQTPTDDTSKQNQESITNFKDIKGKSKETILHQDTNLQSHRKNASLRHEAPDHFTQANISEEGDDNADLELSRHRYLKIKQLKVRAKSLLKSNNKQRKRKTLSGNNSVLEGPSADVSGSEKSSESNDAKSATLDYTSISNMSNFGEPSIANQESVNSDHLNILNSMMQSLSIDSQKQEPSNNQNNSIVVNEEKNLKRKFNFFSFGSTELLVDNSEKEKPSNNIVERSSFESYAAVDEAHRETQSLEFPKAGLDKQCVEQNGKEKEKTSNNGSKPFIFGSAKLSMKDPKKLSKNNLERNPFDSYAAANKARQEIDFSNENEKTSNNTSNAFIFESSKLSMKNSENILERNPFDSYATANKDLQEIGFSKEKETTSNNASSAFIFESSKLSMKNSESILERNPFDSYATANKDHHETDLLPKIIKNKGSRSRVRPKTLEGNNASSNEMVTDPQKISPVTSATSEEEIENQAARNMKKAIQKRTLEDSVFESIMPPNQLKFNLPFDLHRNREDESSTAKENESFDSEQNGLYDQENTQPVNNKENKTCNGKKSEIFDGEENELSNGRTIGTTNNQANEHFSNKENESCRHEEKKFFVDEGNGQCNGQGPQASSDKENKLFNSEKNKSFSEDEKRYPDSKKNESLNAEEKESDTGSENISAKGQRNKISSKKDNELYRGKENVSSDRKQNAEEKESCDVKENLTCNGKENQNYNIKENESCAGKEIKPCINEQGNQTSSNKEHKPCSGTEYAIPDAKQNNPFSTEENGPSNDQVNQTSNNKEIKPCSSEGNGPCSGTKIASTDGKQNKSISAEENVPISGQGYQIPSNKENEPGRSEENEPCKRIEKACIDGKQNNPFIVEENGASNDQGNKISSNKENMPGSSEENGPCSGTKNASPDSKQNKPFNAVENGPSNDQGNQTSSKKEVRPCSSERNGPCNGTKNVSTDGKQNKSINDEENVPISGQGNQISSNKENEPGRSEENG
ncbi:hypothetical protein AVEN_117849-1, partial [Araneus ventricosus]